CTCPIVYLVSRIVFLIPPPTTETYTLSLHDALPICSGQITQTGGRMKFNVPCPQCQGTGKNLTTCTTCGGEGTVERTEPLEVRIDRKSTRLNSSHQIISYAVFCLKKKNNK